MIGQAVQKCLLTGCWPFKVILCKHFLCQQQRVLCFLLGFGQGPPGRGKGHSALNLALVPVLAVLKPIIDGCRNTLKHYKSKLYGFWWRNASNNGSAARRQPACPFNPGCPRHSDSKECFPMMSDPDRISIRLGEARKVVCTHKTTAKRLLKTDSTRATDWVNTLIRHRECNLQIQPIRDRVGY